VLSLATDVDEALTPTEVVMAVVGETSPATTVESVDDANFS